MLTLSITDVFISMKDEFNSSIFFKLPVLVGIYEISKKFESCY